MPGIITLYTYTFFCFLSMSFFFANFIKMYFSYSVFTVFYVIALCIDEEAKV